MYKQDFALNNQEGLICHRIQPTICFLKPYNRARGVMVIVVGNGLGDSNSILEEADCISHSTNILGKGMNPIILPPAMGK